MKNKKIIAMLIIIIILLIIDQVSKILISQNVMQEIVLIENVLSIKCVQNEGVAFGVNENNLENIILSIFVLYVLIRFVKRQEKNMSKIVIVCVSMIIAGGISNLIDRIFRGAVFDFIKFLSLPIFNFSDMFICIGWFIYVIYLLFFTFKTV